MEVTILCQFRSKNLKEIFAAGEIKEFDDARAESLIKRGLVKPLEDADAKAETTDATPTKGRGKKSVKSSPDKDKQ